MVGEGENLIARSMVSVHNVGGGEAIAGIVGLGGMCMEIALELVDSSPINICVWIVGYSSINGLSVHHFDIYRTVRLGGSAVEFDVQIEAIDTTFWR